MKKTTLQLLLIFTICNMSFSQNFELKKDTLYLSYMIKQFIVQVNKNMGESDMKYRVIYTIKNVDKKNKICFEMSYLIKSSDYNNLDTNCMFIINNNVIIFEEKNYSIFEGFNPIKITENEKSKIIKNRLYSDNEGTILVDSKESYRCCIDENQISTIFYEGYMDIHGTVITYTIKPDGSIEKNRLK